MKLSPLLIAALSVAVLLLGGIVYAIIQAGGATHDAKELRDQNAALAAQISSIQNSVNSLLQKSKQADATIGPQGSLQTLARNLQSGEMELSLKSLKIVSGGKPLITLGANADLGGMLSVASTDGTSTAEVSATPGKTKISFRSATGADAAQVVHSATFGDEGFYMQKGPSDDVATRTDGAGLRIADSGADFFMVQVGAGNISMATSSTDDPAKITLWLEGDVKKVIDLSAGTKDATPSVSVSGMASGSSLTLVPDRLSLYNKDGNVTLAAAQDDAGGFVFVNDKAGTRRAIMTAGTEGHGSLSVYGADKRSNTLFPVYNLQQSGDTQK